MSKTAFAVAAHPDDIEFMMSGTLMLLKNAGYEIHYMNVANGCCGTDRLPKEEIISIRRQEAINACKLIGATFHESLADDLAVFYEPTLLHQLGAIMRQVNPEIVLTHMPVEYMEDHSNTCRLAVTAAFCRGMSNFPVSPAVKPVGSKTTIYHALPYGLLDPLCKPVIPDMFIDVSSVIDRKIDMLAAHKSQKEWLDVSQGQDSYLATLKQMCQDVGQMSEDFQFAEGWVQHLHLGFCDKADNPLREALGSLAKVNKSK